MLTRERAARLAWLHIDLTVTLYEETASIKAARREELFDNDRSWYASLVEDLATCSKALGQPLLDVLRPWMHVALDPQRTMSATTLEAELWPLLTDELLAAAPGEPDEPKDQVGRNEKYEPDPEVGF